ncbi:Pre-mRNA-processing factor 17, partial [Fragariocoptes setiger]
RHRMALNRALVDYDSSSDEDQALCVPIKKNTLTGYVETTYIDNIHFETQRLSHQAKALASDGTVETKQKKNKRKRIKNDNPGDVDGYLGPWARYDDEKRVSKPSEEDAAILAEYASKRKKNYQTAQSDEPEHKEKANVHIPDPYDYQGRSFLHAPRDLDDVNLISDETPDGCRVPRRLAHSYTGHTKAISAIRLFPKTGHLLLSGSMDSKIKIWEMYKERRCIMTYLGHRQAVRDIDFNVYGDKFISASYDQYIKLWDVETGQCVKRFTNKKTPYCVKFNPDEEFSHLFLAGMSDKKIVCWDTRTGDIGQEYDRHLGPVNSITFVDDNRKFISTSDDKSLRVWEWDIPVDVKYIADPSLHSMPAVCLAPNNKRMLCQSMDNKLYTLTCQNRYKLDTKKVFKGHMVAGYACVPSFSCDMRMAVSGDADGKIFFWDWASARIISSFKAHDNRISNIEMNMLALRLIIVSSLFLGVACFHIDKCDTGKKVLAPVRSVTISDCAETNGNDRCQLVRGQNETIAIEFSPDVDGIDSVAIRVAGKIGFAVLPFHLPGPQEACGNYGFNCPLKAGTNYTFTLSLPISQVYPKLNVDNMHRPVTLMIVGSRKRSMSKSVMYVVY